MLTRPVTLAFSLATALLLLGAVAFAFVRSDENGGQRRREQEGASAPSSAPVLPPWRDPTIRRANQDFIATQARTISWSSMRFRSTSSMLANFITRLVSPPPSSEGNWPGMVAPA